jgi:hypothetical protein
VVAPDVAARRQDREVGALLGQDRILEADDTADHVDALPVEHPRRRPRVVVAARRTDTAGERRREAVEADLAVLVLDVELDRVQARDGRVLLDLSGDRSERHRHVNASHLVRHRRPVSARPLRRALLRHGPNRLRPARVESACANRERRAGEQQRNAARRPPDSLAATRGATTLAKPFVGVGRLH